jgi:hypothetical protein
MWKQHSCHLGAFLQIQYTQWISELTFVSHFQKEMKIVYCEKHCDVDDDDNNNNNNVRAQPSGKDRSDT